MTKININIINALKNHASKDATRDYLQGINIIFEKDKTIYQASNGYTLIKITENVENETEKNIILAGLKSFTIKPTKNITDARRDIILNEDRATIDNKLILPLIDAKYADTEKLLNGSFSGVEFIRFNSFFLNELEKSFIILNHGVDTGVELYFNSYNSPITVKPAKMLVLDYKIEAVLMPMRGA